MNREIHSGLILNTMDYAIYKLLHLLAVVVFIGNLIAGFFWMHRALKSQDLKIIAHTIKGIKQGDLYFTIPGVLAITAFGIVAATNGQLSLVGTGWILWSIILFAIAVVIFAQRIVPLQKQLTKMVNENISTIDFDWMLLKKVFFQWKVWMSIVLFTPLIAFILMTLKWPE